MKTNDTSELVYDEISEQDENVIDLFLFENEGRLASNCEFWFVRDSGGDRFGFSNSADRFFRIPRLSKCGFSKSPRRSAGYLGLSQNPLRSRSRITKARSRFFRRDRMGATGINCCRAEI